MRNIAADPLKDRKISFSFENEQYTARFRGSGVIGWVIFNSSGIVCPKHQMPELWTFFRANHEPEETKRLNSFFNPAASDPVQDMIKGKQKISLSFLYGKLMDDECTDEERMLIARVLKTISLFPAHAIVFSETIYVDLQEKQKPEDF